MLEIPQRHGPAHDVLVHGLNEVNGRDLPVHERLAQHAARHVKVAQVELVGDARVGVHLHAHLVG